MFSKSSNVHEYIGLVVISTGKYMNLDDLPSIAMDEAVPIVDVSRVPYDKRVFGVVSRFADTNEFAVGNICFGDERRIRKVQVNSVGEGAIKVCNIFGDIENGDLLTSCFIPGYAAKQNDDVVHSYTVAKITCSVVWSSVVTDFEECGEVSFNGCTYRWVLVGCVYML